MRKFAISDIHGCLKSFEALLEKIQFTTADTLFVLGDLIDRGPQSKQTIDLISKMQRSGYQIFCIRGNHDQMMLDARTDLAYSRRWMLNGGLETMDSFQALGLADVPKRYFHFIDDMPFYIEVDDYILVHAGFAFDMPNPFDEKYAMLWQRNWYENINYHWLGDRMIIHGHTPTPKSEIIGMLDQIQENQYLNIDAGCVHKGKKEGLGYLACYDLNLKKIIFQDNIDF